MNKGLGASHHTLSWCQLRWLPSTGAVPHETSNRSALCDSSFSPGPQLKSSFLDCLVSSYFICNIYFTDNLWDICQSFALKTVNSKGNA